MKSWLHILGTQAWIYIVQAQLVIVAGYGRYSNHRWSWQDLITIVKNKLVFFDSKWMIALAGLLLRLVRILKRQPVVACMVICVTADLTVRQLSSFKNVSIFLLFALVIATNATDAQICFPDQAGFVCGRRAIAYVRHFGMSRALCC